MVRSDFEGSKTEKIEFIENSNFTSRYLQKNPPPHFNLWIVAFSKSITTERKAIKNYEIKNIHIIKPIFYY